VKSALLSHYLRIPSRFTKIGFVGEKSTAPQSLPCVLTHYTTKQLLNMPGRVIIEVSLLAIIGVELILFPHPIFCRLFYSQHYFHFLNFNYLSIQYLVTKNISGVFSSSIASPRRFFFPRFLVKVN